MLEGAPAVYIYLAGNRRSTAVSRPLPDIPFCCRQALRLVTCSLFRAQGVNDDEVTLPELPISHLDVPCTLPCNHRALHVLKLSSVPLSGGSESSSTPPGETDSVDTEILVQGLSISHPDRQLTLMKRDWTDCWRGVSLCSINVRVSGQHKCPQLGS